MKTSLLEYQEKAVEKLIKLKIGALYMEQGTGKTRTSLELIFRRLEQGKIEKVLWLCPCSVKENLRRDIIKHVGYMPEFITICGIQTLSNSIKTNLDMINLVSKYKTYLVVDESNLVKNHIAERTKNIINLSEACEYKIILNGTPISRNEADLYAQWYVLDYRVLGYKSYWSFAANHLEIDQNGRLRRTLNTDYLARKIAPYTYQIRKDECLTLPYKNYDVKYCVLSEEQEEHYTYVAQKLMFNVDELKPYTIYRLFTALQNIISGSKLTIYEDDKEELHFKTSPFFENIYDNNRIQCLIKTVKEINEKIIIFAKYVSEIDAIIKVLEKEFGEGCTVRFDGSISLKQRENNIDKFRNEAKYLVANKVCAGYGLNLQFCHNVIYYSNDWDYATRAQSEDRVHRIGQDKDVMIYDILCLDTLDERILKCLRKKESLIDSLKKDIDNFKDIDNLESWLNLKTLSKRRYKNQIDAWEELSIKELKNEEIFKQGCI